MLTYVHYFKYMCILDGHYEAVNPVSVDAVFTISPRKDNFEFDTGKRTLLTLMKNKIIECISMLINGISFY